MYMHINQKKNTQNTWNYTVHSIFYRISVKTAAKIDFRTDTAVLKLLRLRTAPVPR